MPAWCLLASSVDRVDGQMDHNLGSASDFGLNIDTATVSLDNDIVDDAQPLAGAFADSLGREKRIENLVECGLRDSASVIGNQHPDFVAVAGSLDSDTTHVPLAFAGVVVRWHERN